SHSSSVPKGLPVTLPCGGSMIRLRNCILPICSGVKRCSRTCRLDMGLFSIILIIKKQFGLLCTTLQPQPYQSKLKSRSSKNKVRADFIPSLNETEHGASARV